MIRPTDMRDVIGGDRLVEGISAANDVRGDILLMLLSISGEDALYLPSSLSIRGLIMP